MDIKAARAKLQPAPTLDDKLKDVSKMYEKQFLNEMMRAMRKSVSHSEFSKPGMAENIYRDQLDDQYTEQWVENGGNGLAEQIYKELKDKILPSQHSRYLPKDINGNPVQPQLGVNKALPINPATEALPLSPDKAKKE